MQVTGAEAAKDETKKGRFVRSLQCLRNPGPRPAGHRYCIVFNSYDVQSGGKRLMRLRALAQRPECKARLLPPSSRQALIDFFADEGTITASHLEPVPAQPDASK